VNTVFRMSEWSVSNMMVLIGTLKKKRIKFLQNAGYLLLLLHLSGKI